MIPVIKALSEKRLIGKHIKMTLADNKTFELWKRFMPRRKEITYPIIKNSWHDYHTLSKYQTLGQSH
jgi:hypothetical protein